MTQPTGRREWFGTIASLGPPLSVLLDGDDEGQPAAALASYASPAVNDRVAALKVGAQLLVLGRVVQ